MSTVETLQARADELEGQLDPAGKADEANRLLQALAHAFVEQHTSKTDQDDRVRLSDIANDIPGVVNRGVGKSLAAPGRVVDKFHEVYHRRVRT